MWPVEEREIKSFIINHEVFFPYKSDYYFLSADEINVFTKIIYTVLV